LSYADAFIYVSVAQCTINETDTVSGLREPGPLTEPLVHMTWLPEDETARIAALDRAFAELAGMDLNTVIERSDYRTLKDAAARKRHSVAELIANLIHPHAADAGNLGLQLRSSAEMGALLRLLWGTTDLNYALMDGTFALPLVAQRNGSLFYEHLKRLCSVTARQKKIGFFALSKSHGLPAMESIEDLAAEQAGLAQGQSAEHWFLRLPLPGVDNWQLGLAQGRRLPPEGAVSYLVRFHHTTPVMRLDMDIDYWRSYIQGQNTDETRTNEILIFQDVDYACHDQRCYGYPYPLKAAHDRVSLTQAERIALRKQIMDAALQAGMKRALFRDAAQATGHR
jgi:predicted DNA-binding ribbon-helix-helix protein